MRGRKPKPAEQRRREGNPGKRPIGDPVLVGPRLTGEASGGALVTATESVEASFGCRDDGVRIGDTVYPYAVLPPLPDYLATSDALADSGGESTAAHDLWYEIAALLIDANVLTAGDIFVLEGLVESVLIARAAFTDLRGDGSVVETLNPANGRASKKSSPSFKVWREARQMVLKFGEQYGLSPVARARLGLAIGKGRKLAQELSDGLPENPRNTDATTADHVIDIESGG